MKKWEKPNIQDLELSYTAVILDPNIKWVCDSCCTQFEEKPKGGNGNRCPKCEGQIKPVESYKQVQYLCS